jgi:hypothetical protein
MLQRTLSSNSRTPSPTRTMTTSRNMVSLTARSLLGTHLFSPLALLLCSVMDTQVFLLACRVYFLGSEI